MFCGLCSMSPKLLQALPKPSTGQTQGTHSRLSLSCYWELCRFPGLMPSLPSRGEKVQAGSRTEASPYTALGGQSQGDRATADRCAGCSQGWYKPQHQNSAQPCSRPLGQETEGFDLPHSSWTFLHPSLQLPCLHLPLW